MVEGFDARRKPEPVGRAFGHHRVQHDQVSEQPRMTDPYLVASLIVQHVPAAHVELAGREGGGDGHLQWQFFAIKIGREQHVLVFAQLPELLHGGDSLGHQHRDHAGSVGDRAAAYSDQRVHSVGNGHVGSLDGGGQRGPLRQPRVRAC